MPRAENILFLWRRFHSIIISTWRIELFVDLPSKEPIWTLNPGSLMSPEYSNGDHVSYLNFYLASTRGVALGMRQVLLERIEAVTRRSHNLNESYASSTFSHSGQSEVRGITWNIWILCWSMNTRLLDRERWRDCYGDSRLSWLKAAFNKRTSKLPKFGEFSWHGHIATLG